MPRDAEPKMIKEETPTSKKDPELVLFSPKYLAGLQEGLHFYFPFLFLVLCNAHSFPSNTIDASLTKFCIQILETLIFKYDTV